MLPCWTWQFAAGCAPVEVYTLDARMDLSDVRDVVRAYRLLAERGRPGEVVNVGRGVARSSGEVFAILRKLADPDRPVVQTRPGARQNPIADVARLLERTGFQATLPLEQTVADTLAWCQQRVSLSANRGRTGRL